MIAVLKQDAKQNRVMFFGKDGSNRGSCPAANFYELYGEELAQKIWMDRKIEVPALNEVFRAE